MSRVSTNQKISKQLALGLCLACFWLGLTVLPVAAEGEAKKKASASSSQKDSELSTDNLQKQITDLDAQVEPVRVSS